MVGTGFPKFFLCMEGNSLNWLLSCKINFDECSAVNWGTSFIDSVCNGDHSAFSWVRVILELNSNRTEINFSHLIFWQFCCNVLNLITCSAKWIYCWTTTIDHTPAAEGGGALNLRTLVGQGGRSFIALKCRGQSSLDPGWWHLFASVVREY